MRYLLTITLLLISTVTHAATFTAGTKTALTNAIATVVAGDTINITACNVTNWGVVTIMHTKDANVNNRITLTSTCSGGAVFSGNGALNLDVRSAFWTLSNLVWTNQTTFGSFTAASATGGSAIVLDGAQNVILDNIKFNNIAGSGVPISVQRVNGVRATTNITIRNLEVDGYTQNSGSAALVYIYGSAARGLNTGIIIEDSLFKNRTVTSQSRSNHWIRAGDPTDVSYDSNILMQRLRFENDTIAVPGQDAIYIENSGVRVKDNTFFKAAGIESRRGNNNIVSRNTVVDPNSTFSDYWLKMHGTGHTIANNLCYTILGSNTCIQLGMGNTDISGDTLLDYTAFSDSLVAHNTIDGFSQNAIDMQETSSGSLDGVTTVHPSNVTMVNNVIRQTAGVMVSANTCASRFVLISNNSWSGAADPGCLTIGTNNTIAPPEWVGPASGNYTLINDSPLINAGTNVACVLETEVDHDGRIRDTSPDIGAYERNVGDPVIPPVEGACAEMFGSAPTYIGCWEDDLTCAHNVFLNQGNCAAHCESFGTVCVTSYPNTNDSCTVIGGEELCTLPRRDQICVCKRNDEAPAPTAGGTFYVDTSCTTPGDGTSETCGVNGPWNSLSYALDVADCAGMDSGDILVVKGNATAQSDGSWYTGEFDQPAELEPDSNCSGIIVQAAPSNHVVMDGSIDISGAGWTEIGTSNVFQCTGSCGPLAGHPFTAWYKIGAGVEQRLNLVQSNTTCDATLAANSMRYDPVSRRVCAHLSDDSNPADATYFRIPYYSSALSLVTEDVDNMTIRRNPDLSGSFTFTRYREKPLIIEPSVSQGIVIQGLNLSWSGSGGIGPATTATGNASNRYIENEISFVGGIAIDGSYDLGMGSIRRNVIHDIGTSPIFEACSGVGAGCFASTPAYPIGIKLNNCKADDGVAGGTIQSNGISAIGGGTIGYGIGIQLSDCTYGNLVDANFIYDSPTQTLGTYGIIFAGIPAGQYHDENIISNNRFRDIDHFFSWDTDTATSQAGRVNHVVGNTGYNPITKGYVQEDGAGIGGELYFRNNLAVKDNGYVILIDVPISEHWDAGFENNGFECSHAACADEDIISIQGSNYERFENCTPLVDCPSDIGGGNLYGSMYLDPDTLELQAGSYAINQGQNLTELPLDYLGNTRPKGAFSDIGAHESQIESITANVTQYGFKVYNTFLAGGEGELADESVSPTLFSRARFTLRLAVGGSDVETAQYIAHLVPYYEHCNPSCGSWTPISTTCTGNPVCLVDHPTRSMDESISNDISLDGRLFSDNSRFIDLSSSSIPVIFRSTDQVELEFSLGFGDTMDTGDTINFRMQYTNGDELTLYEATPSILIVPAKFRKEFN